VNQSHRGSSGWAVGLLEANDRLGALAACAGFLHELVDHLLLVVVQALVAVRLSGQQGRLVGLFASISQSFTTFRWGCRWVGWSRHSRVTGSGGTLAFDVSALRAADLGVWSLASSAISNVATELSESTYREVVKREYEPSY